jgi:hypothetical protein
VARPGRQREDRAVAAQREDGRADLNTYRVIQYTQFMESTLKNTMSPQLSASLRFGRGLNAQGLR